MDVTLNPGKLNGTVDILPSKSHAHRLMIGGALAFYCANHEDYNANYRKDQFINNDLKNILSTIMGNENETSEDLKATAECLIALLDDPCDSVDGSCGNDTSHPKLFCGESGSTLRFLLPIAAALGKEALFYGKGRLPERPLSPLDEQMANHGALIKFSSVENVITGESSPFIDTKNKTDIHGKEDPKTEGEICRLAFDGGTTGSEKLLSGDYELPGDVSSQFITGLLFALPLLKGDSNLKITTSLQSAPYVDMTLSVLSDFGIKIEVRGTKKMPVYHIPGNQKYSLKDCSTNQKDIGIPKPEGDWSAAAFWLVANALGSEITVEGLREDSLQGDRAIVDIVNNYKAMTLSRETKIGTMEPEGDIQIDASQIPDLVPIVSVLAALTPAKTKIMNAGRLRIKESDRIRTTVAMLTALGADAAENEEGLTIIGRELLSGGRVDGAGDHRIVMSAAIAATCCKAPVTIIGAEAAAKSYPNFFDQYMSLF